MNSILSYKDWAETKEIGDKQARSHSEYLKYINTSYAALSSTDATHVDEYEAFLKNIQFLFPEDSGTTILDRVDYTNTEDLQNCIPLFAQKLTQIAQNTAESRKDPKNTAADFASIDSIVGLENAIYTDIAKKYVADNNVPNDSIYGALSGLSVSVKELYDDTNYFNKAPAMPATTYYNVSANENYYSDAEEYPSELVDWTLGLGFNDVAYGIPVANTTALSGYINFDPQGDTIAEYDNILTNAYLGETQYQISGSSIVAVTAPTNPTNNVLNRYFPTIATIPLVDTLYTVDEIGGYNIPKNLGLSLYYGKNRKLTTDSKTPNASRPIFPNEQMYSNGIAFTKMYQSRPIVINSNLNWMDIKYYTKTSRGIVGSSKMYQEMIPYKTQYEQDVRDDIGMSRIEENLDPWTGTLDASPDKSSGLVSDFRLIYNLRELNQNVGISGHEFSWSSDIYGNNFALYKQTKPDTEYEYKNQSDGTIYVRLTNKTTVLFTSLFSGARWDDTKTWDDTGYWPSYGVFSDFEMDKLKDMKVYYNTMVVVGASGSAAVQDISIDDSGTPTIDAHRGYNFNIDPTTNVVDMWEHFDHFYDDRYSITYIASSNLSGGVVNVKLYSWKDQFPSRVLDTSLNTQYLSEISGYQFISMSGSTMDINEETNEMIMSFVGITVDNKTYIVNLMYDLAHQDHIIDIVLVEFTTINGGNTIYDEPRNLIDINYFDNKLLFIVEGAETGSKYLQMVLV
jgi:hypothetical protein